jgi:hypothetical protein
MQVKAVYWSKSSEVMVLFKIRRFGEKRGRKETKNENKETLSNFFRCTTITFVF